MSRLILSLCFFLTFFSYSLASSCKEAKLCCVGRNENCVVKKGEVNTVGEEKDVDTCYCDLVCLKNGDCCPDFKKTCGVESRPYRYHNMVKREAAPEVEHKDTAAAADEENDDDPDYINEEGYDDEDPLNDDEDDGEDEDDDNIEDDEEEAKTSVVPAVMLSQSLNITAVEGQTIWLPCEVQNKEEAVVIWGRDEVLIFQNMLFVKDPRFSVYKNSTLSISNLMKNDYGAYFCKIIDVNGNQIQVTHHVIAPQPPKVVQMLPLDRDHAVQEGKPLKIQCLVTGHPKPKITWSQEGRRLTEANAEFRDQTLYIKSASRHDAGTYQCLASNGFGNPAVGKVVVRVLHAPEVHVKKSVVNTDEGYEAVMLCSVKSDPTPLIVWRRNSEVIYNSHHHHISMDKNRDHSTLKISKVTPKDFGRYTCVATNENGVGEGHVTLVKEPGRAMWVSRDPDQSDAPILQWAVESVQPLTDIELRYLKIDQSKSNMTASEEEWIIVKPEINQPNGNVYTVKHTLNGLSPGKYAAQVRAKNTHGWSQMSDQHFFEGAYENNDVYGSDKYEDVPAVAGIRIPGTTGGAQSMKISSLATLFLSAVSCALVRFI